MIDDTREQLIAVENLRAKAFLHYSPAWSVDQKVVLLSDAEAAVAAARAEGREAAFKAVEREAKGDTPWAVSIRSAVAEARAFLTHPADE